MSLSLIIDQQGGMCPYQASGRVNGYPFYFRARGSQWSFHVSGDKLDTTDYCLWSSEQFSIKQDYCRWPNAGYIDDSEANLLIMKGVVAYLKHLGTKI